MTESGAEIPEFVEGWYDSPTDRINE
jgi:hypothetical protein